MVLSQNTKTKEENPMPSDDWKRSLTKNASNKTKEQENNRIVKSVPSVVDGAKRWNASPEKGMFVRQMKIKQLVVITDDVDMGSNSPAFILSPLPSFSFAASKDFLVFFHTSKSFTAKLKSIHKF